VEATVQAEAEAAQGPKPEPRVPAGAVGLELRLRPPSPTAHNLLKGTERHGTLHLRATQRGGGELAGGMRPWTGIVRSHNRCGVDLSAVNRIGALPKRSLSCIDFLDVLHPLMKEAANPLQHQSWP
jgi:hypothetical protein